MPYLMVAAFVGLQQWRLPDAAQRWGSAEQGARDDGDHERRMCDTVSTIGTFFTSKQGLLSEHKKIVDNGRDNSQCSGVTGHTTQRRYTSALCSAGRQCAAAPSATEVAAEVQCERRAAQARQPEIE